MAASATAPLGAPIWIDLLTSDLERAQRFYGNVFGWTFDEAGGQERSDTGDDPGPDYGGYVNASVDGRVVAGLMPKGPQIDAPDGWTTYLHTADVDATLNAVVTAGGQSYGGSHDVPAKGRMAMLADMAGGTVGLWQPAGHDGFEVVNQAGAPVWHQLTTRDYRKALDFYTQVFGWQLNVEADTDDFRYSNALFDGEPLLGVMDGAAMLPAGEPSRWDVFLGADDVDKTLEVIADNGGTVIRGAEDTPYGRLASVTDPTGAGFNLASIQD